MVSQTADDFAPPFFKIQEKVVFYLLTVDSEVMRQKELDMDQSEQVVEYLQGDQFIRRLVELETQGIHLAGYERGRTNAEWKISYRRPRPPQIWQNPPRMVEQQPFSPEVGF